MYRRPANAREHAKRRDGKKWTGVWYYRTRDQYGERTVPRSTGQTSRDRAEQYVKQLIEQGELIPSPKITLAQWVERRHWWIWDECEYIRYRNARAPKDRPAVGRKHAERSRSRVENHILPEFGNRRLETIRPKMLDDWLTRLSDKLAPKTVNNIASVFRVMLEEAVREEFIRVNPFDRVRPLVPDSKERGILTVEEARVVLQPQRWKSPIQHAVNLAAAATGMRQGEILALQAPDIQDGYVIVKHSYDSKHGLGPTKTKRSRIVPLPRSVKSTIDAFLAWEGFVFSSTLGDVPVSGRHCSEALYAVIDSLDKDRDGVTIDRRARNITFHSWRAFQNSFLRTQGVSDTEIRAVVGHSTQAMTELYTRWKPDDFKAVTAAQERLIGSGGSE